MFPLSLRVTQVEEETDKIRNSRHDSRVSYFVRFFFDLTVDSDLLDSQCKYPHARTNQCKCSKANRTIEDQNVEFVKTLNGLVCLTQFALMSLTSFSPHPFERVQECFLCRSESYISRVSTFLRFFFDAIVDSDLLDSQCKHPDTRTNQCKCSKASRKN